MISIFDLIALLLVLSALFGWLNRRFVRLPHAVGLLVMGLVASLLLVAIGALIPHEHLSEQLAQALKQIDFTAVVMNGMLAFLLFAGALNLDFAALRNRAGRVAVLALVGTTISTGIVGVATWAVAQAIGYPLPLAWALVFGALISPTDPVAVLSMLKGVDIPRALQIELEGEALFNDGIAIVLFTLLVGLAAGWGNKDEGLGGFLLDLVKEAGGGVALGAATGYLAYRAMRAIDDFPVEVLITLALVAGTNALAQALGISGPLAVVAAGLLIGEKAPHDAMSERTESYVSALWTLIDEVLNSVLFLLIGLEVLVVRFELSAMVLAAAAVPIVSGRATDCGVAAAAADALERKAACAQCAVSDLGRRSRRHLGGACARAAGRSRQIGDPVGDLRGGALFDHRAGHNARPRRTLDPAQKVTASPVIFINRQGRIACGSDAFNNCFSIGCRLGRADSAAVRGRLNTILQAGLRLRLFCARQCATRPSSGIAAWHSRNASCVHASASAWV